MLFDLLVLGTYNGRRIYELVLVKLNVKLSLLSKICVYRMCCFYLFTAVLGFHFAILNQSIKHVVVNGRVSNVSFFSTGYNIRIICVGYRRMKFCGCRNSFIQLGECFEINFIFIFLKVV